MKNVFINPYKHKSQCDIRRCTNRAEFSIGDPNEGLGSHFLVCKECAIEIVVNGTKAFGIEKEINNLTIETLKARVETLTAQNELLKEELDSFEVVVEAEPTLEGDTGTAPIVAKKRVVKKKKYKSPVKKKV